jgi:hypothetical protein
MQCNAMLCNVMRKRGEAETYFAYVMQFSVQCPGEKEPRESQRNRLFMASDCIFILIKEKKIGIAMAMIVI